MREPKFEYGMPVPGAVSCRYPGIVMLALLALLLSACSGGGSQASPTAVVAQTALPGQTENVAAPTAGLAATSTPGPAATVPPPTLTVESAPTGALSPTTAAEETFPNPDGYTWAPYVQGLDQPVGLVNAGDGSGRLFILEQAGRIRVVQNGNPSPDPFLDITSKVSCCGERGLLGLAFHPDYQQNGEFYINYTDLNGNTVIARYHVSGDDPNRADPESEEVLLHVDQPYPNHNGGETVFGPDGYLYLGLGDGGSAGDPQGHAQSLDTLLGKILRIDVNGGDPYAIPPDNPFADGGGKPEIWAYGLRNPWRFSFDRATGDVYIGDVGQASWEEIDYLPAGSPGGTNFGWNYREGKHPYEGTPPAGLDLTDPAAEYGHDQGCSVTGGVVYRGENLTDWQGIYLFGDYCSGLVWGLMKGGDGAWTDQVLFQTGAQITSFGEDESGEVYLTDHSGTVYRLEAK